MVSILGHMIVGMLTVGTARAEEDAKDGAKDEAKDEGVQDMLDSLPTIQAPKAKAKEKPETKKPMDLLGYYRKCSKVVMPHFKPPKSAVKKNPDIEFELLVQVAADGAVLAISAAQGSGHKGFDKAAVKAMNKAGGLPAPPAGWNVDKDRVILTFKGR